MTTAFTTNLVFLDVETVRRRRPTSLTKSSIVCGGRVTVAWNLLMPMLNDIFSHGDEMLESPAWEERADCDRVAGRRCWEV